MPEQTYDRLSLAKEQLDTALDLALDAKSYASALTLGGAAEEIFGNALKLNGEKSAMDEAYEQMSEFYTALWSEHLDRKVFVAQENAARNALRLR